jgi:hypothetical protein
MIQSLPNNLYFVVMALAVIGWLALIFFPHRSWANYWFFRPYYPSRAIYVD